MSKYDGNYCEKCGREMHPVETYDFGYCISCNPKKFAAELRERGYNEQAEIEEKRQSVKNGQKFIQSADPKKVVYMDTNSYMENSAGILGEYGVELTTVPWYWWVGIGIFIVTGIVAIVLGLPT